MVVVVYHQVYFNSQPHKEADKLQLIDMIDKIISTHSLTRRLTGPHELDGWTIPFQLTASQGG